MSDAATARRALKCLDLTDLSETCSDPALDALCQKALTRHGPVAAICIWPQFVDRARGVLRGTPVRLATVVNFPAGDEDPERVIDAAEEAVGDGADEIDCVLPYKAFLRGETGLAADLVSGVRDVVDGGRTLKVILETGALGDAGKIEAAGRLAIAAGADFLKTSTGKFRVSATPEAAEAVLAAIRAADRPVGLKVSGGIRTVAAARTYLDLADRIMGEGWATPKTFRIGATALYDALVAAIEGRG
ncbi:MAG TPA: deoxyribose-phosphate aldolase [Beijerinckiaceae bacterium]|jgi:deoxyribose-phosphate aldolase